SARLPPNLTQQGGQIIGVGQTVANEQDFGIISQSIGLDVVHLQPDREGGAVFAYRCAEEIHASILTHAVVSRIRNPDRTSEAASLRIPDRRDREQGESQQRKQRQNRSASERNPIATRKQDNAAGEQRCGKRPKQWGGRGRRAEANTERAGSNT